MPTTARMPATQSIHMILGQLFTNKVIDERLLAAFAGVPRERFVPPSLAGSAYVDDDLPLGNGRFLIAPLPFARMIQMAEITPADKVLVVGCGSGYSLAVLTKLAKEVIGCDSDAALIETAKKNLSALGIANSRAEKIVTLAVGYDVLAPYDAIIIEGAAETVPERLLQMLSAHGRLVAVERIASQPLAQGLNRLAVYIRAGKGFSRRAGRDASLPLLPGMESKKTFQF